MDWEQVDRMIGKDFPGVASITTDELATWLDDADRTDPFLLDARAAKEYATSHLRDAVLAPSFRDAQKLLASYEKSIPIVIYCSVGYRSAKMTRQLTDRGWSNVANLKGSIFQWANENRPVFAGQESVSTVHPFDKKWGQLLNRRWHP